MFNRQSDVEMPSFQQWSTAQQYRSQPGQMGAIGLHEPETRPSYRNTRLVVDELERVDLGKMNLQLIANEEEQDRA